MRFRSGVVSLCLILFALCPGTLSTNTTEDEVPTIGYLMVLPRGMSADAPEKVCLSVYNVSGETVLAASVRLHDTRDTKNYDAFNTTFRASKLKECFYLHAPPVNGNNYKLVAITLDLQEVGGDQGFRDNSTKKLMVVPTRRVQVYIKTDKEIYKPGQKVQFRVLQLRGEFPTSHKIEKLTISDPKGRKLMVRYDLTPKLGLVSDEFQLITEPVQGDWKISVSIQNQTYKTEFKVEEYVLPKYEVKIQVPNYLHPDSDPFDVKVCAKYTYGMPVHGSATITVSRAPSYRYSNELVTKQVFSEELGIDGCAIVKGDPALLRFKDRSLDFTYSNLVVNAKITESGTGVVMSDMNGACLLRSDPYQLHLSSYKHKFKPGLPWSVKITYKDVSQSPLPDRPLVIEINKTMEGEGGEKTVSRKMNVTTDMKGQYDLKIGTTFFDINYDITIYDPSLPKEYRRWWSDEVRDKPWRLVRRDQFIRLEGSRSVSGAYLEMSDIPEEKLPLPCEEDFTLTGTLVMPHGEDLEWPKIAYMVLSRSEIVLEGQAVKTEEKCVIEHTPDGEKGSCILGFEIALYVKQTWMPHVQVLAFAVRENKEVVAGEKNIEISDCLANEPAINFSSTTVRPGGEVSITLSADPKSTCALSIVDKSVHLLGGDNTLKKDKIVYDIREQTEMFHSYVEPVGCSDYNIFRYRFKILENDDAIDTWGIYSWRRKRDAGAESKRNKRSSLPYYGSIDHEQGAYLSFQKMGLLYLSNLRMQIIDCEDIRYSPIAYAMDISEMPEMADVGGVVPRPFLRQSGPPVIQVRNYFPETWKWELIEIGENGLGARTHQTMPDTITEWVATSFCISEETGIGVSEPVTVRGFKPLFLSMTLPYSIIRGEEITITTSLFNYLSSDVCLEVVVVVDQSLQFLIAGDGKSTFTFCSCGGVTETFSLDIVPTEIGEIQISVKAWSRHGYICGKEVEANTEATDAVERTILVEAEGEEIETTASEFLCVEKGSMTSWSQDLTIPESDFYLGSERAIIQVLGSVMGPVMENLNHLIRVPSGCGEQNMVTMVPNLVVLRYLEATGNLPSHTRERIIKNIELGYQRELNYLREDGSFSAFGDSDESGSTWLTAFVISTFMDASEVITVDRDVVERAMDYLHFRRDTNGCVKKFGMVHNKRMMGGAGGKNALNAYVDLALLKSGVEEVAKNSTTITGCHPEIELKLYTTALMFYTSTLTKAHERAITIWDSLKTKATFSGGSTLQTAKTAFWSDESPVEEQPEDFWWYYSKPSDAVEVTGYILMGYVNLEKAFPGQFPLSDAYPIVQWLTSQRNAYGGWSSTQNTIIGLSALANYAAETFTPDTQLTITAQGESQNFVFNVNSENQMVTQRALLSPIPSAITFYGNGTGCALLQTSLRYNVPRKQQEPSFSVTVYVKGKVDRGCEVNGVRQLVVCAQYTGTEDEASSNMAVFEIRMLSGVSPVEESLKQMAYRNKWNGIKRYEIDGKKVIVYFEEIGNREQCAAFEVIQKEKIKNLKPAVVRVYDYYDPKKETSIFYDLTCRDEGYQPGMEDCTQWRNGDCISACGEKRDLFSPCFLLLTPTGTRVDYCQLLGDIVCGDTGHCVRTQNYYRCSCKEGFLEPTWGYKCIPKQEVPLIPELPNTNNTMPMYNCSDERAIMGVPCIPDEYDPCVEDPCKDGDENCTRPKTILICTCPPGYSLSDDRTTCFSISEYIFPEIEALEDPPEYAEINVRENPLPGVKIAPAMEQRPPCPVCLSSFPKPSEYGTVFCPKVNAYVVTNTSSKNDFLMRAIVVNGEPIYGDTIRHVSMRINSECVCNNLQDSKSILLTQYEVQTDPESSEKFIKIDESVTITTKRGWRKVQSYSCEDGSHTPEPEGEINVVEPEEILEPEVPDLVEVTSDLESTDDVPKM